MPHFFTRLAMSAGLGHPVCTVLGAPRVDSPFPCALGDPTDWPLIVRALQEAGGDIAVAVNIIMSRRDGSSSADAQMMQMLVLSLRTKTRL